MREGSGLWQSVQDMPASSWTSRSYPVGAVVMSPQTKPRFLMSDLGLPELVVYPVSSMAWHWQQL